MHFSENVDSILAPFMILPLALCMIGVPFLTGIVTVAEERNLGVLTWQMTQPVSALKQWVVKVSVAFTLCLVLGLIVPSTLILLGNWLSPGGIDLHKDVPDLPYIAFYGLCYMAWFSVLAYASTISPNSIRAMITGLGLLMGIVAVPAALNYLVEWNLSVVASAILIALLTAILNWISYLNFRAVEISTRRLYWQSVVILLFGAAAMLLLALITDLFFT